MRRSSPPTIWPLCYDKDGSRGCVTVAGGSLEFHGNTVTVITPASEKPEDIDLERAIESEKRAEALLAKHAADLDETRAQASLQRALRRIDVARKYGKQ